MTGDLAQHPERTYAFGPFRLIPERQLLVRGETPIRIGSRALDLLLVLLDRPGEVVGKRELLSRVWPDMIVEEGNLKTNIATLRRALGDESSKAKYIATVIGRGYRFIAPVQTSEAAGAASAARGGNDLPAATTRIFGRADAIDLIRRDLEAVRLVSIVGAGGIGKTTVAIAAARAVAGERPDGAAFIDLAAINDPQFIPAVIASALGVGTVSGDSLAAVVHVLKFQQRVLLFDNCEHLLPAVASVVDRLTRDLPNLRILTTSREPLRLRGERVHRLRGLACDFHEQPTAHGARTYPAVELFAARAAERSGYELTDAEAPAVAEICRRLDGNALAIELAATQTAVFPPVEILRMLDDSFRLLKLGPPGAPARHQSLLATLDWSYGLLSDSEAALLRAISVFAGVFSAEGARAVSAAEPAEVLDALGQLAAKSLLAINTAEEVITYRLLETTRAYCIERLRISNEDDEVRRRHAEHMCAVLERAAAEWDRGPAHEWGATFARMVDDLRGALAWTGRHPARRALLIRLTAAGILLWNHLSLTEECRLHVSKAVAELAAAGQAGTAVEMHLQMSLAGTTMFSRGLIPEVMNAVRRALDIASEIGDTDYRLRCLRTIGIYELFIGQFDAGLRTLESCASVEAAEDSSAAQGETHLSIGELFVGRLQSARQRLERLYRPEVHDFNDSRFVRFLFYRSVDVGSALSHAQWLTGSLDTAARTAASMVDNALRAKYWFSVSNCISWACPIFFLNGHYEECRSYVELLNEQVLRHGVGVRRPVVVFYRGALACQQQDVPKEGIDDLERGIEGFRAVNHLARMPFYFGILADAFARCGRLDEAATALQTAQDCAAEQNERWCMPELLRIQASILTAQGYPQAAEAILARSMALAGEMGALSWRLRAANDLAKLWRTSSRADDARNMLLPVYSEFTEGFETRDLLVAADLLGR